jgi:hypothetical protein
MTLDSLFNSPFFRKSKEGEGRGGRENSGDISNVDCGMRIAE